MIRAVLVGLVVAIGVAAVVYLLELPVSILLSVAMLVGLVWMLLIAIALGPAPGAGGERR